MKILLFGKVSQVGWELQRSLNVLGDTVRAVQPHVIGNAAAHTAVDKAKSKHDLARTLDALAPQVLPQEAKQLGAWLVHYSTDYVFDGSGGSPWKETETPAPLSVYGKTKREGEQLIQDTGCQHLIFRTSWVYAAHGSNFAKIMLGLAKERERLTVIDDPIGAPTGADLLADITAHAIRHLPPPLRHNFLPPSGIYHVAAGGHASWYSYARFVLEAAQKAGVALIATPDRVDPISTSAYPTPARRLHNSHLDTTLLRNTFCLNLPHWQSGVARMQIEILEK